jgi:hypothetical protein
MIDGRGDPNASVHYRQAIQALYGVSYALKFALKRRGGPAYRVGQLEGLWWVEHATLHDGGQVPLWTAMIGQPDEATPQLVAQAARDLAEKKPLPAARALRLERYREGLCAQVLHVGPYADEGPTIERLHAFIAEQGHRERGKHHEIYLGDPRRAAPERPKTIIRQPISTG